MLVPATSSALPGRSRSVTRETQTSDVAAGQAVRDCRRCWCHRWLLRLTLAHCGSRSAEDSCGGGQTREAPNRVARSAPWSGARSRSRAPRCARSPWRSGFTTTGEPGCERVRVTLGDHGATATWHVARTHDALAPQLSRSLRRRARRCRRGRQAGALTRARLTPAYAEAGAAQLAVGRPRGSAGRDFDELRRFGASYTYTPRLVPAGDAPLPAAPVRPKRLGKAHRPLACKASAFPLSYVLFPLDSIDLRWFAHGRASAGRGMRFRWASAACRGAPCWC
jgi:hypothetical protein